MGKVGDIISHENCDECGGDLKQIKKTMHASGFVDSAKCRCIDCKTEQNVAMQG